MRHRADRPPQDLGLIGGSVEREGEQGAEEGVAEEPPQADRIEERPELAAAVVDEEELGEERRSAEEIDIAEGRAAKERTPREARQRHRDGEEAAEDDRDGDELDRHQQPFEHAGSVPAEQLEVHVRRMPRSDQRSMPAMPKDETIDMAR